MKNFLFKMLIIFLIVVIIYSGYEIYIWYTENNNNNKINEEISNLIIEKIDISKTDKNKYEIDFEGLKQYNSSTVAWIEVKNTNIEYPVVQANDNSYYLKHNFYQEYNSAGWIFADYRNKFDGTDKNIIIFGHNRRDGSMFGTLKNVLHEEWYDNEENIYITFATEKEVYVYKVFSIYQILSEDYYIKTDFEDDEFSDFIRTITDRSIKDFGEEISNDDSILTLSTCANDNKYRVVLHAVLDDG